MANERTRLSYIRSAAGFFIVDIPAVWWIELPGIQLLDVISLMIGLAFLGIGVQRIYSVKAVIDQQPV